MARITRIALDVTLVSLRKVGPAVSRVWFTAKTAIIKTPAKPLVCNSVVAKAETAIDKMTDVMISYITSLRDQQLPKEQAYLERELEKIKSRLESKKQASKTLRPALGIVWQYAKLEIVPPMTVNFFNGPVGRKLERTLSQAADNFIAKIQNQIREIELEEAREIKRKEAEAKAAEAKIKAEAKRIAEEAKRKEEEKLAKEAKSQQQREAEIKAKADEKANAGAAKVSKPKITKKAKREPPKKNRREYKKGSAPKSKK